MLKSLIFPVTRSEVLKKVRRNSMEGILFLESEAEKKEKRPFNEERTPFETIPVNQSIDTEFRQKLESMRAVLRDCKARLYQQSVR